MIPSTLNPRHPSPAQRALPLGDESSAALRRTVFETSGLLRRGWTFDRAMNCPAVRTCIENTARAILRARARRHRRAARAPLVTANCQLTPGA